MEHKKLLTFDSTLRDGAQGANISFSVEDKLRVIDTLDRLGIDFIEAGNPYSNPAEAEFFQRIGGKKFEHARIVAFGSTRRKGIAPEEDANLKSLLAANTEYVAIFGKSHIRHATDVLKATPEEIRCVACILSKFSEIEKNPRKRYGYLAISRMLAYLIGDERYEELLCLRMKYVEILYNFSLNNRLQQSDITDFNDAMKKNTFVLSEAEEMQHILSALHKFGDRIDNQELDKTLIHYLGSSSPLEKELARLILSGNLLFNFQNPELQDKVLDEIGKVINLDVIKPKHVHIGEEMHRQEFKTSLVFPPNNGGNEDIEQQSENILREILAMMNAKGGVLYIGVNDDGNVVGLYDDLHYFADSAITYNETKAKDNFENHFSCLLTERLGAENASKFDYGFENREGYIIFKVEIPILHMDENNLYRVGNTVQERKQQ